ncbi:cold-responsive protein kinase 1-like [Amaranthus tricolor]|uniref:cold-responsive protein kinase 1-like n=1 Tax=Amaranthus tricolor TaxID=29722 RepID=UPI00258AF57B|nr:cold-responsive protein kinase 1-like [Amaranthus tricolor]
MGGVLSSRVKLVRDQTPNKPTFPGNITCFSYKSLEKATNNFRNRVREDGFSSSYKGNLDDGSNVIVKVYRTRYEYAEFTSMIKIMFEVRHQNLVQIIGYCVEDDHRMLVHDFIGDYSLFDLLFSNSIVEDIELDWRRRVLICRRIARGLEYLHFGANPPVVHRDVKPSSIFVDSSFNPKIADFEISSYLQDEDEDGRVAGTICYIDAEYLTTGRYSEKTDVYSFGITLLEIISGKKTSFGLILQEWAWELRESGRIPEIVDPNLAQFSEEEVIRFTNVALSCVQFDSDLRPSMSEVRLMLSDNYHTSSISLARPRSLPEQWNSENELTDVDEESLNR